MDPSLPKRTDPKESSRLRFALHPVAASAVVAVLVLLAFAGFVRSGATDAAPGATAEALPVDGPDHAQSTGTAVSGEELGPGPQTEGPGGEPGAAVNGEWRASEQPGGELVVFVTGAVQEPGVVTVPVGSRAQAAILAAGGLTAEAVMPSVNLAGLIADGDHIHVAIEGEAPVATGSGGPSADGLGGGGTGGCVDLNTATDQQLQELDGIGPKLSARILERREATGGFTSTEELLSVSGIGQVMLERISAGLCG